MGALGAGFFFLCGVPRLDAPAESRDALDRRDEDRAWEESSLPGVEDVRDDG
jgi:hypothetical protein